MGLAVLNGMEKLTNTIKASEKPRRTVARKGTARDVMTVDPETVSAESSLYDAASVMAELGVRHLPVTDAAGRLIGMLSDRDVRTTLGDPMEALRGREDSDVTVADAMRPDPLSESLEASVDALATILADEKIGAIPIVDEGDRPVGIVSYVDLLSWYAKNRG